MRKNKIYLIFSSVILGIVITLLTGLLTLPGMVGATWRGYPFHWMSKMVVDSEYSAPLVIWWDSLIYDFIFWSFIVFLILLVIYRKKLFNRFK
jgi:hypothetical protein